MSAPTPWQACVIGLAALLEAAVVVEVVKDVRGCLSRGQKGQAVASALSGAFATAFVLLLAGLLLAAGLESGT